MQFAEKATKAQTWLNARGYETFVSSVNAGYIGLDDKAKEKLKLHHKYKEDAIRNHFNLIKNCDAILVLNYDKNGIENYIGGNAFLEMGIAYFLKKPIYLLNQIPKMPYYETEIIAMKPTIINDDLSVILKSTI